VLEIPSVLVVGCPEGLTLRVHDAAVSVGALARLCGVVTLGRALELHKPVLIAMTEELYGFDPEGFAALARLHDAEIYTLGDVFEESDLSELLARRIATRRTVAAANGA
jgi:hypothetical protein